jgi:hypothetical protein
MNKIADKDTIAKKVRKILALANNNSKAASAAAMAAALLAEHNLTMERIEEGSAEDTRISDEFETRNWCREMRHALAELNFCFCAYKTGKRGHDSVTIIGTQANVETTKVMLEYLVQTGIRLSKEQCKTDLDRQHFRKGFSDRVAKRLDDLRRQRESSTTQTGSGNALPVLASLYKQHSLANDALWKKVYGDIELVCGRSLGGGGESYSAGYAAGGGVSLDPQVGRASGRKALR